MYSTQGGAGHHGQGFQSLVFRAEHRRSPVGQFLPHCQPDHRPDVDRQRASRQYHASDNDIQSMNVLPSNLMMWKAYDPYVVIVAQVLCCHVLMLSIN